MNPEDQYHQELEDDENKTNSYISPTRMPQQSVSNTNRMPAQVQISLTRCKILMKQNSQLNKQIINYFKQNLHTFNKNGFVFEWIGVHEEEMEFYEEQGIEKFPVLIADDNTVVGISNILKSLNQVIASFSRTNSGRQSTVKTPQRQEPQSKKETEEEMHDFLLRELKSKDAEKGDDDQDNISNTISQRVSSMNQSRKDNGLHSMGGGAPPRNNGPGSDSDSEADERVFMQPAKPVKKKAVLTTSELIKKTTKGDDEDRMMSKFWENQEETEM